MKVEDILECLDYRPPAIVFNTTMPESDLVTGDLLLRATDMGDGGSLQEAIRIALVSVVRAVAEKLSATVTERTDYVVVDDKLIQDAAREVSEGLKGLSKEGKDVTSFYELWFEKVKSTIIRLAQEDPEAAADEIILRLCRLFRIDSVSALRVITA